MRIQDASANPGTIQEMCAARTGSLSMPQGDQKAHQTTHKTDEQNRKRGPPVSGSDGCRIGENDQLPPTHEEP